MSGTARSRSERLAWGVVLTVTLGAVVWGGVAISSFRPDPPATNRPALLPNRGYVTSDACRACHPGQYATWSASFHPKIGQLATRETVLAPVDDVDLEAYGVRYHVERRGDEIWAQRTGEDAPNGEAQRFVMTTGAHHFQAYWLETGEGRKVGLFPFAYQIHEDAWIPFDTIMLAPPEAQYRQISGRGGEWNTRCVRCHSTGFRPRTLGFETQDTEVSELGVACEACHGPGERHAQRYRGPWERYASYFSNADDESIVNPATLPPARGSEVCAQCHAARANYEGDHLDHWDMFGTSYRPGHDIRHSREIVHEDMEQTLTSDIHTRFWSDGMTRVSGREYNGLVRSPCYAEQGDFSCFSCHTMHQTADDPRPRAEWTDDQLSPGKRGPGACLGCHPQFGAEPVLEAHTFHRADSSGSDCLNCHMPNTAWGLQKATRSHEISNPSVAESVEVGRPNACNLCHLDKTLAWTAEHLESRYGISSPPLDAEQTEVAAAVLWLVAGDAGQRALISWAMGWEPAQQASGTDWLPAYLGMQLGDPYTMLRFVALRSLRGLPGYEQFDVDFTAPTDVRAAAIDRAGEIYWGRGGARSRVRDAALLMNEDGGIGGRYDELIGRRNHRRVYLIE